MQLYRDILVKLLEKEEIWVLFPNLEKSGSAMAEMACYNAILEIKSIIEDDRLSNEGCIKIEGIENVIKKMGVAIDKPPTCRLKQS